MYVLGSSSHSWSARVNEILAQDSEVQSTRTLVQTPATSGSLLSYIHTYIHIYITYIGRYLNIHKSTHAFVGCFVSYIDTYINTYIHTIHTCILQDINGLTSEGWDRMYHPGYFVIISVDFW